MHHFTALGATALALAACGPSAPERASSKAPAVQSGEQDLGDPGRGRELVRRFECNRCHDGDTLEPRPRMEHCVHCHRAIIAGETPLGDGPAVDRETLERWKSHLTSLNVAPSLTAIGDRFRVSWLVDFLSDPQDLRPNLRATMPRLGVDEHQAKDIVAFLTSAREIRPELSIDRARASEGRRLLEAKGCATCHAFSGVPTINASPIPVPIEPAKRADAILLAPDLWFARDRLHADELVRWLVHPAQVKNDTLMPDFGLSRSEAEAIAAYLLFAKRGPRPLPAVPRRLPELERQVSFAEVDRRVFHNECWHCHSDPAYAFGSGGPGNTGGFGFNGRGINLASYASINSGFRDAQGRRRSLFERDEQGVPRIVGALLARQAEEAGHPVPGIRGMPLGLPALSPEDLQLVETWIAQGRPE